MARPQQERAGNGRSWPSRATLASGTGMLKTAKLHGVGCGTVQRISRELAT